ncbi:basic helix-loop-helix domain-containing protein [Aspergillus aculeatinus CBS 121060]|uniref:HLH transcription factor n=1 Tax=Aspergillus aculeatinus CBS 121060 TaxID=1448322 RepID=A0ACD1H6W3_9EURO|nr:HLH transcription factor [Aspergillus aculeatinus CBS 121060]RAH69309.1 HLH transcription factor [Aspergillus aculeatinus CBS 121060]
MAMPSMGSDFQLFSPNTNKRNSRDSQAESMSFAPSSTTDEATQDWTQWMRWDDQGFAEGVKELSQSPFDLAFTSPNTSTGNPSTAFFNKPEFSPDISLDCTNLPFDSFFDRGYNSMTNSKGDSSGAEMPSTLSTAAGSPLSPDGITRKRKSGSDDDGSTVSGVGPPGKKMPAKKRAHNVIEKRYRANLNEKIAELRDSVPSLRASKNAAGSIIDDDEGEGVTPASKLNKASILSKATEYIRHLEIRNKRLEEENTALKNRLRLADKAAEQMITSTASVSSPSNYTESGASSSPSVFSQVEDSPSDHSPTTLHPPEGLMKVPDAFQRLRDEAAAKNSAFSQSYMQYPSSNGNSNGNRPTQGGGGRSRSYYPNKYMLGALAGLMVLEGMGSDKETDSTAKGLLALPVNLLNSLQNPTVKYWMAMARSFWYSWHARAISHFLILATLVVGSAFVVFVYLFNAGPKSQPGSSKTAFMSDATLSSSNFRRQAWLTSIQQVGVPRHRFFHEWYVVTSRCFEYVLRCLLGWKLYSSITGVTVEDDKGRVKSWDIAIDAQLAGGDPEISKSRLVLTIFAAGTLPRSPMRMMLKALHCRILLWRVGVPGSWTFHISNDVARSLAGYQWDLARKMHAAMPKDHPEALPSHLAALLQLDCDEVMIDTVVQRAANLTWNRPTQEGADDDEALLDVVEEDPAIRSSLDALAAWWSSHLLQRALLRYFEASSGGPDAKKSRDLFKAKIKIALDVAPQPSAAHTRALVMKAVFFDHDRATNIGAVLAALPKDKGKSQQSQVSNFLDSSLPVSVRDEIAISVRCAMIAAIFTARTTGDTSLPASFTIQKAITWFNQLPLDPVDLTLIGFASVYHLLHVLASDTDYLSSSESSPSSPASRSSTPSSLCSDDEADDKPRFSPKPAVSPQSIPNLGRVASELMYWARNAYNPAFYGFTPQIVKVIENECTSLCHSAGVDVADYSSVREEKSRAKQVKEKKKKRRSRRA